MKQCSNCGQINQDSAVQCSNCGQYLELGPVNNIVQQKQSSPVKKVIIIVASLLIILCLCCCGGFGLMMKFIKTGAEKGLTGFSYSNSFTGEEYGDTDNEDEDDEYDTFDEYDYSVEDNDDVYRVSEVSTLLNSDDILLETDLSRLEYDKELNTITLFIDASNGNKSSIDIKIDYIEVNNSAMNVDYIDYDLKLGSATEYDGMSNSLFYEPVKIMLTDDFNEELESITLDFKITASDGNCIDYSYCEITELNTSNPSVSEATMTSYSSAEESVEEIVDESNDSFDDELAWMYDDYQLIGNDEIGRVRIPTTYIQASFPGKLDNQAAYVSLGTDQTMVQIIPYEQTKDNTVDLLYSQLTELGYTDKQELNDGIMITAENANDKYPLVILWVTEDKYYPDTRCIVVSLEFTELNYDNAFMGGAIIGTYEQ